MLVLGHIVLATLLRCPGILATKPISITFGDWNNASNAKTKRCGLRLAANSMQSVNWSITCCVRSDYAAGILSSMSVAAAGDWRGSWRATRAFATLELMSSRDCLRRPGLPQGEMIGNSVC
jgi:hypothetical protein